MPEREIAMGAASANTQVTNAGGDGSGMAPSLYFTTFVGLMAGFTSLWLYFPIVFRNLFMSFGMSKFGAWSLVQSLMMLFAAATIVGIVVWIEREPLASIGLGRPNRKDFLIGVTLFVGIAAVGVLTRYAIWLVSPHAWEHFAQEQLRRVTSVPIWVGVMMAIGAGISEEIAARGFAITRLAAITHRVILAATIALMLDLAAHVPFWGWRYALAIAPIQLVLTVVYLWRGNLVANIVAHSLLDAFPFLLSLVWLAGFGFLRGGSLNAIMARDYERQENYSGAIAEYTRELERKPGDLKLLRARAKAEAREYNHLAALNDFDEVLRRDPKDLESVNGRMHQYSDLELHEQALADAGIAIALSPQDAELYVHRANVEDELKLYDAEAADFSQAIKLRQKPDAFLLRRRGSTYLLKKDCDRAIADLTDSERIDQKDSATLNELGSAMLCKGEPEKAMAKWTQALDLDPNDDEARIRRGQLYADLGQYEKARSDLRLAVEHDDENEDALAALSWFLSTCRADAFRDGKQAFDLAGKTFRFTGWNNPWMLDTLAAAYAEMGNFAEAAIWEQHAIDVAKRGKPEPEEILNPFRARLALYLKGQPYREVPKFAKAS